MHGCSRCSSSCGGAGGYYYYDPHGGENRLQLGTLKALGYSNAKIAGNIVYALSASVLGSIVGMVIGFVVFPLIIGTPTR